MYEELLEQNEILQAIVMRLVTAIEWEVPPIRDGVSVERRLDILLDVGSRAMSDMKTLAAPPTFKTTTVPILKFENATGQGQIFYKAAAENMIAEIDDGVGLRSAVFFGENGPRPNFDRYAGQIKRARLEDGVLKVDFELNTKSPAGQTVDRLLRQVDQAPNTSISMILNPVMRKDGEETLLYTSLSLLGINHMRVPGEPEVKPEDLETRLRRRAEIRREIPTRKSVAKGEPDRLADLLEEAADEIKRLRQSPDDAPRPQQ